MTETKRVPDPMTDPEEGTVEDRRTGNWPNPDDERAQPGDVIGIETEGEITELGDTAEDEDARRRAAEKDAEDNRYKDL
jgi:hypothetical protein